MISNRIRNSVIDCETSAILLKVVEARDGNSGSPIYEVTILCKIYLNLQLVNYKKNIQIVKNKKIYNSFF